MLRRVFIAINLPENVKKKLSFFQEELSKLFDPFREEKSEIVRWTKPENLHITLVFLGLVGDEELLEISRAVKGIASKHSPLLIDFNKIAYGPPEKPPKMVWIKGEKNPELSDLKADLDQDLMGSKGVFTPHITLGRIKRWQWQKIEPEERPEIAREIDLSFEAVSIEVMESELKRKGPKYTILESHQLGN